MSTSARPLSSRSAAPGSAFCRRLSIPRRPCRVTGCDRGVDRPHPVSRPRRSVIARRRHRYLFSSWNTVYREMLACFDRRSYRLAHELVDIELEPLTLRLLERAGDSAGSGRLRRRRGIDRACPLLPDVLPQYSGYVAWRGVVPETELDHRQPGARSTTRSRTTSTRTATSSSTRFPAVRFCGAGRAIDQHRLVSQLPAGRGSR